MTIVKSVKSKFNTGGKRTLHLSIITLSMFTLFVLCFYVIPFVFSQTTPPDLTNQDSQYAAIFEDGESTTILEANAVSVAVEQVANNMSAPIMVVFANDDSGRLFVVDQIGVIWIIDNSGTKLSQPFLDIRDRMVQLNTNYDERGLLSLAFSPNYSNDGKVYVHYSAPLRDDAPATWDHTVHISQFTVSENDSNMIDPDSERIIMAINEPQANHNGGPVLFGSDGNLFIVLGDGGNRDDEGLGHTEEIGNAQDLTKVLGKILRIDVTQINSEDPPENEMYIIFSGNSISGERSYDIPEDNPFVNNETTPSTFPVQGNIPPEIYTYGLRNPAYAALYSSTYNLILVADAGQDLFEEIDLIVSGGNYGWHLREGTHCFNATAPDDPSSSCTTMGYIDEALIGPVFEGGHDIGNTVVGGAMYWGNELSELTGKFVFGYFASGQGGGGTVLVASPPASWDADDIPASSQDLVPADNEMWTTQLLNIVNAQEVNADGYVRAISTSENGEIYISMNSVLGPDPDETTGRIYRIVQAQNTNDITLYGDALDGWGLTEQTITSPGPEITFQEGELFNMTLISADGQIHNFYVDYNGNNSPDDDEPISPDFSGAINFQFTPDRTGEFQYYCNYHPNIMFGNASIIPEFSQLALLIIITVASVILLAFKTRIKKTANSNYQEQ